MHDDRRITEGRIDRVLDQRLPRHVFGASVDLTVEAWEVPGEPVPVAEALAASFAPFAVGSGFARPWGTTWFRMTAEVPSEWAGEHVQAEIHLGYTDAPGFTSEGLLWRKGDDGGWEPWRGIHPANHRVTVAAPAQGGERVELLLEAASNPSIDASRPDPNSDITTAGRDPIHVLGRARLAVVNDEVQALVLDMSVLRDLMRLLPVDQPHRHEVLRALEDALDRLDLADVVATAPDARAALAEVLARPAPASAHRVSAIGHAHIDSAWLWPIRETKRKCARTFANVLRLMDDYPELRFGCSQAAQYEWILDEHPSLFAQIQARVAEGRWVPLGGMWVEADTNLAGGEALLRQLTHGQRFFQEHFGVTCTEGWLPDVFGYPASLPGILAHAGLERFLTQKMSWNQSNRFPHHTFWWEGIDGSSVFTHFPPVATYNATFEAAEMLGSVRRYAERGRASRSLLPFGWGDGGGGPSPKMMEVFRRSRDLEGLPRIEIESPAEFFAAAEAEYPDAPRWVGELYLEMHRGTYTSQAATKAGNRRSEMLLREAELWSTRAAVAGASAYPAERLDRLWKTVLLHQFHDILPGSSIGWVHREAEATYAQVAEELEVIVGEALRAEGLGGAASVANAAPHARDEVTVLPPGALAPDGPTGEGPSTDDGPADDGPMGTASTSGPVQALADGSVAARLAAPALGVASLRALAVDDEVEVDGRSLRNGLVALRLDDRGALASLVHRASGREAVAPGQVANRLEIHPDLPNTFDAWDIEHFDRRRAAPLTGEVAVEVTESGPLLGRIRTEQRFGASRVVQTYELRAGSARVDIHTEVDWHERETLLQVAFPLDLLSTEMTREIQLGHVRTPIHTNTGWDAARFEVCAHRWVDVAEPGFGVALLNDAKHGHHGERQRGPDGGAVTALHLTLLRAARYPDPEQDQGTHRFTYSVLVHDGSLTEAGVIAEGYRLNLPLRVVGATSRVSATGDVSAAEGSVVPEAASPVVALDHDAVVVEAVKLADDGSGDVIVRAYESFGGRARVTLVPGFAARSVRATDAHERDGDPTRCPPVEWDGTAATLELRPFQITTLRFAR